MILVVYHDNNTHNINLCVQHILIILKNVAYFLCEMSVRKALKGAVSLISLIWSHDESIWDFVIEGRCDIHYFLISRNLSPLLFPFCTCM